MNGSCCCDKRGLINKKNYYRWQNELFRNIDFAVFDKEYKDVLAKKARFLERDGNILKIKDEYLYVQNDIILDFMKD